MTREYHGESRDDIRLSLWSDNLWVRWHAFMQDRKHVEFARAYKLWQRVSRLMYMRRGDRRLFREERNWLAYVEKEQQLNIAARRG